MAKDKFKSIDELRIELDYGNEFQISYAGERYDINSSLENGKDKFYCSLDEVVCVPGGYATFDEMLDNFKATDGKTLREFLLDAEVEDCAVGIGEMGEMKRWEEKHKTNPNAKLPYPEAKGQFNLKIGEGNGGLE